MYIKINDKDFDFVHDYKGNERLRQCLNQLTNKIWEFDFEAWYQSGYWNDRCHLYSLMDNDDMVSHITVTEFDAVVLGQPKKLVQLGTVMTEEKYRGLGLNRFLMEKVLEEWDSKSDFIYLYANDTVLDFYPKFGLSAVAEYEAVKTIFSKKLHEGVRKMDIEKSEDLELLDKIGRNAVPLYDLSVINNIPTIMFYCQALGVFKDSLYYLENIDAIGVAEYEGKNLIVHDILATKNVDVDIVVDCLINENTENVILRFIPKNKRAYQIREYKEDDLTLFVSSKCKILFENNQLIFPTLSHT